MADSMCPLLNKLPPELRNNIYELVFGPRTFNVKDDKIVRLVKAKTFDVDHIEVDLASAKPPSKDLMLTSRQIYDEAGKMYKAEYRRFWSKTHFVLSIDEARKNLRAVESLNEDDVQHITSLRLTTIGFRDQYLLPLGCWQWEVHICRWEYWLSGFPSSQSRKMFVFEQSKGSARFVQQVFFQNYDHFKAALGQGQTLVSTKEALLHSVMPRVFDREAAPISGQP